MGHFIARWGESYLTPRRATGKMHEQRAAWSIDPDDAKVFNTKGAATTSAKSAGAPVQELHVIEVRLVFNEGVLRK